MQWHTHILLVLGLLGFLQMARAEDVCEPPLKSFGQLAAHLEEMDDVEGATVLHAEMSTNDRSDCDAVWVVEVLTRDNDVVAIFLDAQSFARLSHPPDYLDQTDKDPASLPDEAQIRPIQIKAIGTPGRDLLEGEWSDDISEGGAGRDVFFLTPGSDVILDFNPQQDFLDMINFAVGDFGFGTLSTWEAVRAAASRKQNSRGEGTEIDLDGDAGTWSVFLVGVWPKDLNQNNILFPTEEEPAVPPEVMANRMVTMSDGSTVLLPGYSLDQDRRDPILIDGSQEALKAARDVFFFDDKSATH